MNRFVNIEFKGDGRELAKEAAKVKRQIQDLGKTKQSMIDWSVAKGFLTEAQGRQETLKNERALTKQLIAEASQRATALKQAPLSADFTEEDRKEALVKLDLQVAQARANLAQKEKEARVKAEKEALKAVEEVQKQALDQVKLIGQQRLITVQAALNQGLISEEQAEMQRLDIRKRGLQEELAATQGQILKLEALPKFSDPEQEKQRQTDIRAARSQTTALTLQLLENEAAKQKALQEQIIKGIEDQEAKQKRAHDAITAQLEKEKGAQDLIIATLERRNKLEESRVSLQKARSDLAQTQTQIELDQYTRAQQIRQQLDDDTKESATEQAQLQRELAELTGSSGTSELQILQRKQALEDQLGEQRLAALEAEQTAQRANLEFEIQRNALIARRGELEARLAEVQARQKIADAEFELQKALVSKDATRIANARQLVQLSRDAFKISQDLVKSAQAEVSQQQELATNQRESLKLEQQGAREKEQAAERLRNLQQDAELVKAGGQPGNNQKPEYTGQSPKGAGYAPNIGELIQSQLSRGAQIVLPNVKSFLMPDTSKPLPGATEQGRPKARNTQQEYEALIKRVVEQINVVQRPMQLYLTQILTPLSEDRWPIAPERKY